MENMLKKYQKSVDKAKVQLSLLKKSETRYIEELQTLNKKHETLQTTREIFQKAATLTQNHLATHLSAIVTKALKTVFYEKDISFHVEFVERRNTSECDMWIEEDGNKYSLLDSRGYGMADIVSFALKIAYLLLHNSDNILIIDEPGRNISKDKHDVFSQVIKELSKELGIQFIIATHSDDMISYADKSFLIKQDSYGISQVKET